MTAPKGRPRKEKLPEPVTETIETVEIADDPMEMIAPYLAQAGVEPTEISYYLYRVNDGGKARDSFLFKCRAEDYDAEDLGKRYGSGTYRLKIYVKDANNPNGVIRAAPVIAVEMPPGYDPAKANAAPVADTMTPASVAQIVAETLKGMLPQMVAPAPPQQSRADMLAEISAIAALFKNNNPAPVEPPPAPPPAPDPIQAMRNALALAKEFREEMPSGDPDREPGTMEVIKAGIETFRDVVNKANPTPAATAPALPNPTTATNEGDDVNLMLKMQMKLIVNAAAKNAPVDTYAEMIYDNAPPDVLQGIITGQTSDGVDWWTALQTLAPEVAPHAAWFYALRNAVIDIDKEATDDATTAPGADTPV